MWSHAKHAGNYAFTAKLCQQKLWMYSTPNKQWLCSLNFTNVNIRIMIEISYVEKKITNFVVSAYFIIIFSDLSFWVQGKPYSYFSIFIKILTTYFIPAFICPKLTSKDIYIYIYIKMKIYRKFDNWILNNRRKPNINNVKNDKN